MAGASVEQQHLTLFVYTDEAEISPEAHALMIRAGYLPVRVKSLDAYRIVERTMRMPKESLDKIGQAAMWAVSAGYDKTLFVNKLGELLGIWTIEKP